MSEKKPSILIVEQSPATAKQIAKIFEGAGFEIAGICHDGLDALQKAKDLSPSVVSIDLVLPKLSGLQVAANILRNKLGQHVVAVSAVKSRDRLEAAKGAGVGYYVLKPDPVERLEKVASAVKKSLEEAA